MAKYTRIKSLFLGLLIVLFILTLPSLGHGKSSEQTKAVLKKSRTQWGAVQKLESSTLPISTDTSLQITTVLPKKRWQLGEPIHLRIVVHNFSDTVQKLYPLDKIRFSPYKTVTIEAPHDVFPRRGPKQYVRPPLHRTSLTIERNGLEWNQKYVTQPGYSAPILPPGTHTVRAYYPLPSDPPSMVVSDTVTFHVKEPPPELMGAYDILQKAVSLGEPDNKEELMKQFNLVKKYVENHPERDDWIHRKLRGIYWWRKALQLKREGNLPEAILSAVQVPFYVEKESALEWFRDHFFVQHQLRDDAETEAMKVIREIKPHVSRKLSSKYQRLRAQVEWNVNKKEVAYRRIRSIDTQLAGQWKPKLSDWRKQQIIQSDTYQLDRYMNYFRWWWEEEIVGLGQFKSTIKPGSILNLAPGDTNVHFTFELNPASWNAHGEGYQLECEIIEKSETIKNDEFNPRNFDWVEEATDQTSSTLEEASFQRTRNNLQLLCLDRGLQRLNQFTPYQRANFRWKKAQFISLFENYTPKKFIERKQRRQKRQRLSKQINQLLEMPDRTIEDYKQLRKLLWNIPKPSTGIPELFEKLRPLPEQYKETLDDLKLIERHLDDSRSRIATERDFSELLREDNHLQFSENVRQMVRFGDFRTFVRLYEGYSETNNPTPQYPATLARLLKKLSPEEFARSDTFDQSPIERTIKHEMKEGMLGFRADSNPTGFTIKRLWKYKNLVVADVRFQMTNEKTNEKANPAKRTVYFTQKKNKAWETRGFFSN